MTDECGTTINILALIVTFFGFGGMFKAAAGMGDVAAKGAPHHNVSTSIIREAPAVLGDGAIIPNQTPMSASDIFTSSSNAVVNPLSFKVWVTVTNVQSAPSICGLKPLTLTGISGNSSGRPLAS
ncbi:hypothetical protein Xcab_00717 [Xenorhabdus cabanillasii JM26]|nr:hypothetical protein Xcab_00717 [Xenorhabdus cabanillasii JM26]